MPHLEALHWDYQDQLTEVELNGTGVGLIIITMEVDSGYERWLLKVDVERNVCIWVVLSVIENIVLAIQ